MTVEEMTVEEMTRELRVIFFEGGLKNLQTKHLMMWMQNNHADMSIFSQEENRIIIIFVDTTPKKNDTNTTNQRLCQRRELRHLALEHTYPYQLLPLQQLGFSQL